MIFDLHIHTEMSCDSEMKISDAMKRARSLGIGMTVTDHMDINDYRPNAFVFDVDVFFEQYEPYRGEDLLLGIELGFRKEAVERNMDLVNQHDFDFILGSTHAPYATQNSLEYYDVEYYQGKSKQKAYEAYFNSMLTGICENPDFDSLAHIDYIARYAPYEDSEIDYRSFSEGIDQVLKELAVMDKSLEIGTRRFKDTKAVNALICIYKRFRELGGRTVTLGSDSHTSQSIGQDFKQAMEIAEACNLEIVYYKKRKKMRTRHFAR